jgi:hypothetical protein
VIKDLSENYRIASSSSKFEMKDNVDVLIILGKNNVLLPGFTDDSKRTSLAPWTDPRRIMFLVNFFNRLMTFSLT